MLFAWWRRWWSRSLPLGRRGENAAAEFLQGLGYRILERGRRLRAGELDLVALDGDTVVFVEVKTRSRMRHGSPLDAVDLRKQRRMTQAALAYLKQHGLLSHRARFDVVSVLWPPDAARPEIRHVRNAFEARGSQGMFS